MLKNGLIILALLIVCPSYAEVVCSNYDGDTLKLCTGQSIRLFGVDAPELKQPIGRDSRDYLRRLTAGREVKLDCAGKSFKRAVCRVEVITGNGSLDASREMAGRGFAFDSPDYSHGEFSNAEAFAKSLNRGVWALPGGGVRPWDYRHNK